MHEREQSSPEATAPAAPPFSGLMAELGQLGRAVRHLFGAQMHLLAAELGLARTSVSWMLVAGLAATVAGTGLGLTFLGLIGLLLARWFGSWLFALIALCGLQIVFLLGAIWLFRRCMHWMSFPSTRDQWSGMMQDTLHKVERKVDSAVQNHRGGESQ